uniref:Uncharacterized protein n=1 Tax=Populus trichocarpa TaxID=3694 RepID=U7DYM6_POPTR
MLLLTALPLLLRGSVHGGFINCCPRWRLCCCSGGKTSLLLDCCEGLTMAAVCCRQPWWLLLVHRRCCFLRSWTNAGAEAAARCSEKRSPWQCRENEVAVVADGECTVLV